MSAEGLDPALLDAGDQPSTTGGAKSALLSSIAARKTKNAQPAAAKPSGPKLKPCYWTKLEPAGATIWAAPGTTETPFPELVDEFTSGKVSSGAQSRRPSVDMPQVVQLVDARRSQNIGIGLGRLRLGNAELMEAIRQIDATCLPFEKVEVLLSILPTQDEVDLVVGHGGDPSSLGKVERFFLETQSVKNCRGRMLAAAALGRCSSWLEHVDKGLVVAQAAATEVASNTNLFVVLRRARDVGNVLNQGSARGDASAVKLESLTNLARVRSNVKRHGSLLNYIARIFEPLAAADGNTAGLRLLPSIGKAAAASDIMVSELRKELADMKAQLAGAEKMRAGASDDDAELRARLDMELPPLLEALGETASRFDAVVSQISELLTSFGERGDAPVHSFFASITHFAKEFDLACDFNAKLRKEYEAQGGFPVPRRASLDAATGAAPPLLPARVERPAEAEAPAAPKTMFAAASALERSTPQDMLKEMLAKRAG